MPFTESFIISIAQDKTPQESLIQAAQQAGVQLNQIEDIFWAEDSQALPFAAVEIKRAKASLQQAIHSACESVYAGNLQIVAAGGKVEQESLCLLICSPAAIGRLNLTPIFRVAALGFGPQAVEQAVSRAETQPSELELILTSRKGQSLPSLFQYLAEHPAKFGLFEHQIDDTHSLVILIEAL